MKPFRVSIVEQPEIAEDSEATALSSAKLVVCVSCSRHIYDYWTADMYYQDDESGGWRNTSSFGTNSVSGLLGHLHDISRSDIEKYLLMTADVSKILLPAMSVPVVEYVMVEELAVS